MTATNFVASRRAVLTGALVGALAWASRPLLPRIRAQEKAAAITAELVDRAPTEPGDPLWSGRSATAISLNPQNLVLPSVQEAGTKSIDIRALYDAERLSILIGWKDAARNVDPGTVMQYRDGVAVQFPKDPSAGPTSFMMGVPGLGVSIYHWKSDWQFGPEYDVDEAYPNMFNGWYPYSGVEAGEIPEATDYLTKGNKVYLTGAAVGNSLSDPAAQEAIGPVQKMEAEGFGTLEPDETQDGKGMGAWKDGEWRIVISIPRKQPQFTFEEGSLVPLGFAVWDGSRSERNGQKAFSDWQETRLGSAVAEVTPTKAAPTKVAPSTGEPVKRVDDDDDGVGLLVPLLSGIGGAVLVGVSAVIGLRMRRARRERDEQV